jgi:hypothetical protein
MNERSENVQLPTETSTMVERWEQLLRVLDGLTTHERQKHFYMGSWGVQTDCGTVACAAGHCALDPWFRERGFIGKFDHRYELIFPQLRPEVFFGQRGHNMIFTGPFEEYEDVVAAVKAHIEYLKAGGDPNEYGDDDELPF